MKTDKNKKTFKVKIKAQDGYQLDPWQRQQSPYQYPNYQPIEMSDYSNQMIPVSGYTDIAPQGQMEVQPMQYPSQNSPNQAQSNNAGRNIGNIASGIGRAAGQALNAISTGGPQLINALLPEQSKYREDRSLQRSYNPYPNGTGSQALYRNGGSVDRFTKLSDEEAAYYYMNDIPLPMDSYPDNMQPILPYQNNYQREFQPVNVPQPTFAPQRNISYNRMVDVLGQPTSYLPQFEGFNYNEATQALQQLPESIDNVPVVRSNYQDYFQNFQPNSQSNNWIPYDYDNYDPQPLTSFEDGGEIPNDLEGIPFNPTLPSQKYDKLKFSEAFKTARKDLGSGKTFTWKGKEYTTNIANEQKGGIHPSKKVSSTVKNAKPSTQRITPGTAQDFINNVQGGVPANQQQYNFPTNPHFNPNFDLSGYPQPEIARQDNRPAPKGLQKLAINPQFNNWVENVGIPATTPLDIYGLGAAATQLGKKALSSAAKSARNAANSSLRRASIENVRRAEEELAQYNLQRAKQSSPYPINQWSRQPGQFEYQGQSPYTQYANEPVLTPYSSPYQQVMEAENMTQSPFSTTFPGEFQRQSPVQELLDMEHAWSPIRRSGILPKKFNNGGYVQGQETDLSPSEIKRLLSLGYEIDIL